ncbi:MAG: DUF2633 family protein [Serratia symbiotica]|nr:DUF2633 family protein [Serratia symbiotica]
MRKITPGKITKIVFFIIFIFVVARLLYAILVVVPDHPEKKLAPYQNTSKVSRENQDSMP